jgi:protein ImuB
MAFVSIYVPEFMVQAAVRTEPQLRDGAVALVEGSPPLGKVVAANEAARQIGIELGMAKSQAAQFYGAQIRHRSPGQEKAAHAALLELGCCISPRVEDTALDTIVLDLAGLSSLFGSEQKIANELLGRAAGLGLRARIAVSSNLDTAIHAARGFAGVTFIPEGEESEHIASLPLQVLSPPGEILAILEGWGVRTCRQFAALPVLQLSERLGPAGVQLHELARGTRVRSMVLAQPSVYFQEEMELEDAVEELEPLSFLLGRLLDQLCQRLAMRSFAASAVRLRLDLEPFYENAFELSTQNLRPKNESKTYQKILALPVPLQDSKMLLKLIRLQLQSDPPNAAIRKIGLAADPARPRVVQEGLFLPSAPDPEKLELTIARLAKVVGEGQIGSPELLDTHRPGEFRMTRFLPAPHAPQLRRRKGASSLPEPPTQADPVCKTAAAFRIFRPSLAAKVTLSEGRPVRVFFRGVRGEVVAASGPWRTSGDWWQEDRWQQDEWDLEIRFAGHSSRHVAQPRPIANGNRSIANPLLPNGFYRFFYDSLRQSWFVRGRYD